MNVGIVENVDTTRKTVGARGTPKVVRKENTKPRMQRTLTILTRRNQQMLNQKLKLMEFDMTYHNVDALQESEKMRGSEWIKIGVDTGAGKRAWPQSITYGTTIPGDSDLTFRTATGELVKGGKRVQVTGCADWESNLRVRGVQSPGCTNHLCLLENTQRWVESLCCMVTKVTCFTKVRMLRRKLMFGSRRS